MVMCLYFFAGLFVGTAVLMLITAALRPMLLELGSAGKLVGFLSPFLVGVIVGVRTAYIGYRDNSRLLLAIRRAFLFR